MPEIINLYEAPHARSRVRATGEALGWVAELSSQLGLLRMHHERLPSGCRTAPPHRHTEREEAFVVLSGHPTAELGTARRVLKPGDVVMCPAGEHETHTVVNESDEEVTLLVVSASTGMDQVEFTAE
ncbi:MAG: cupin domain-containing protein [Bradymonadia bacterium]